MCARRTPRLRSGRRSGRDVSASTARVFAWASFYVRVAALQPTHEPRRPMADDLMESARWGEVRAPTFVRGEAARLNALMVNRASAARGSQRGRCRKVDGGARLHGAIIRAACRRTGSVEPNGPWIWTKGRWGWKHNSIVVTLELPPVTLESHVQGTGAAMIGSTAPLPAEVLTLRQYSEAPSRDVLYARRQAPERVAICVGGRPRVAISKGET